MTLPVADIDRPSAAVGTVLAPPTRCGLVASANRCHHAATRRRCLLIARGALYFTRADRIEAIHLEHGKILRAMMQRGTDQAQLLLKSHIEQRKAEVRKITLHALVGERGRRTVEHDSTFGNPRPPRVLGGASNDHREEYVPAARIVDAATKRRPPMQMTNSLRVMFVTVGLALGSLHATAAPPPTAADVGDADSFGKRVVWVGLATTGVVRLSSVCPVPFAPNDPCVVLNTGATSTSFNFPNLGSITLPANSTSSLICHWATPNVNYVFDNQAGTSPVGRFIARATYRLESEVLADPALINPQTAAPFGGGIDLSITVVNESKSLAVGEFATHLATATRTCIAGLVTKAALLRDYGLSEAQAKKFFQKPITIRVGTAGLALGVRDASVLFSTRFTTDDK